MDLSRISSDVSINLNLERRHQLAECPDLGFFAILEKSLDVGALCAHASGKYLPPFVLGTPSGAACCGCCEPLASAVARVWVVHRALQYSLRPVKPARSLCEERRSHGPTPVRRRSLS